jgi:hypothetical protein
MTDGLLAMIRTCSLAASATLDLDPEHTLQSSRSAHHRIRWRESGSGGWVGASIGGLIK